MDKPAVKSVLKNVGIALGCIVVIIAVASQMNPVFVSREPVAQRLVRRDSVVAHVHAPWIDDVKAGATGEAGRTELAAQEQAFFEDLVRTRRIDSARARRVARVAVEQADKHNIPPALVFGVMLTENSRFESKARSNVGAVGLMQIYPKVWLKALSGQLGSNLEDDATNLKYGTFILNEYYYKRKADTLQSPTMAWRKPLLRYNGCVRGTNTPRCKEYPSKVKDYVEELALSLCGGEDFDVCVARPIFLSLRENERARGQRRRERERSQSNERLDDGGTARRNTN